jgi:glycosyltransferase involved in cell wall biosynthesis
MRVVLCSPGFPPQIGGAETWARGVFAGLAARGHEVRVVAGRAPGVAADEERDGVRVLRARGSGRAGLARAVAAQLRAWRPDVAVAQFAALPPGVVAARALGIPAVAIVHDLYGIADSVRHRGVVRGTVRTLALEQWMRVLAPDGFLTCSASTGLRLAALRPDRPVTVVPSGADHLPPGAALPRDPRALLFVGRLVASKGVEDLIDAVAILRGDGIGARLTVVGTGPQEAALRERAKPLAGAVRFAGRVDDARLERELRSSAALVLPSRREGWGLVLTEAAARGTPYVAYDIPAVREQHETVGGGVLVAPGAGRLAAALRCLLADSQALAELGRRGQAAAATLTWARSAAVAEAALQAAIDGPRPAVSVSRPARRAARRGTCAPR